MRFLNKFVCFILFLILFVSCSMYRWYKLKGQLSDVKANFSIQRLVDNNGKKDFVILNKPVLQAPDVFFLSKKGPSTTLKKGDKTIQIYRSYKVGAEELFFDIKAYYNKDGYLYRVDPPNILTNLFDDYSYKRLGFELLGGDVSVWNYRIRKIYKKDTDKFKMVTDDDIVAALGDPDKESTLFKYVYHYKIDTPTKVDNEKELEVKFIFNFDDDGLVQEIWFYFSKVNLHFIYKK